MKQSLVFKSLLCRYIKVNLVSIKRVVLTVYIFYKDVYLTVFPNENVAAKIPLPFP